jgi:hypothetical protein
MLLRPSVANYKDWRYQWPSFAFDFSKVMSCLAWHSVDGSRVPESPFPVASVGAENSPVSVLKVGV